MAIFTCTGNYVCTVGKLFKPTASKTEFKRANAIKDIFGTTPKPNKYCHVVWVP
jgi:hypothetical protein